MVKRGGTKRKVEIKKITNKNSKATTFTKRRDGLFSKAAQLCLLSDAQIAILATPSSSHSNVSFFSFGHSSVDSLVSAYLSGQRPAPPPVSEDTKEMREDIGMCMARKDLGLGYWWEDEKLAGSKDPEEISDAIESMKILVRDAERLLEEDASVVFDQREGSLVVHEKKDHDDDDDILPAEQNLISTEDDQIMSVSDSFCNYNAALSTHGEGNFEEWSNMDLEQLLSDDFRDEKTEEEDEHQSEAVSCSNNNNAQTTFGLDLADLDTVFEGLANLDDEFLASFLM